MTRIIAGRFGGRRLRVPRVPDLRPTGDRVREAWFSILQDELDSARVLDLFAGTGALGLEALSRGAQTVTFVENNRRAVSMLEENVSALGVEDDVEIIRIDALKFLERPSSSDYDLAFADPPYRSDVAQQLVTRFHEAPFSRIFSVEHPSDVDLGGDDRRQYGGTGVTFCFA